MRGFCNYPKKKKQFLRAIPVTEVFSTFLLPLYTKVKKFYIGPGKCREFYVSKGTPKSLYNAYSWALRCSKPQGYANRNLNLHGCC